MPTKRRVLLFLIVLAIMLLLKRAFGQEVAAWHASYAATSIYEYARGAVISGLLWGVVLGIGRVIGRSLAAQKNGYFTGDLVTIKL
jgi:hypothetical protein